MESNTRRKQGNVSLTETPAIIKKIEDSPGWRKNGRQRKKRHSRIYFKEWNMPEQQEGYIKAKQNDFL